MGDIIKRKGKDGRTRYYARYLDTDGKRKMRATNQTSERDAKRYLGEVEARIARGKIGIPEPTPEELARQSITVKEIGDAFVERYASPKIKDRHAYMNQVRAALNARINPTLGHHPAAAVTSLDVERWRDELLADGCAANTVINYLGMLSKVFGWGNKMGLVACGNPARGIDHPRRVRSLDYLDGREVGVLLAHAEEHAVHLHPLIAAAVYSGMRKGELFGLRWPDVHLDAARLDVMRSYKLAPKSGKARHLPAHPELVRILRQWKERCPATPEGLVFPVAAGGSWRMGRREDSLDLGALLKAAECHVPVKPWHALRHTFASHFMMRGGNILTLQKLLGHADINMTMVYAHLAPDFMAQEVARLEYPAPSKSKVADLGAERRRRTRKAPQG